MKTEPDVELRSPHPGEWFRVNPDPNYRIEAMLIEHEGKTYMIAENMVEKVPKPAKGKMKRKMIFVTQNRDGETFLWPVPTPVAQDHLAFQAMHEWICFPTVH